MKIILISIFVVAQLASVFGAHLQASCWAKDAETLSAELKAAVVDGLQVSFEEIDPVHVDSAFINTEELKFWMENMTVAGLRQSVVESVNVDLEAKTLKLVFNADFIVKSKYWSIGHLLSQPFYGLGEFTIDFDTVLVEITMSYSTKKDKRQEFINLEDYDYTYLVGEAKYDLGNLFYGDKRQSDKMHRLLHKNSADLSVEFAGNLLDSMATKIFDTLSTFVSSRPLCK